jgi:hypothetical protein
MWFTLTLRPEKTTTTDESSEGGGDGSGKSGKSGNKTHHPTGVVHDVVASIMIHIDRVENRITPTLLESILTLQSRLSSEITMVLEALTRHMKRRKSRRQKRRERIAKMLREERENTASTTGTTGTTGTTSTTNSTTASREKKHHKITRSDRGTYNISRYRYNVEVLMRGVSLAVAVTPEMSHKHPELHLELGAFDVESTSKPGEYNGFLDDNYNRVDLAGLQTRVVQGKREGGEARCYMRMQTNIQLRNEPLHVKTDSSEEKEKKENRGGKNAPQQRFVMDMAKTVVLLQPGVVVACTRMMGRSFFFFFFFFIFPSFFFPFLLLRTTPLNILLLHSLLRFFFLLFSSSLFFFSNVRTSRPEVPRQKASQQAKICCD